MGLVHYIPAAGGAKLALHDLGGSGPPLLILHCNSIPGLAYLPVAEALHGSFHCWALDQRGHGCSAHAALLPVEGAQMGKGAVRLEPEALWPQLNLLVGDVLAAADWLTAHGGPVRVFAHSLGGVAALAAEIRQPGTFRAMYLFEPVIYDPQATWDESVSEVLSSMALKRRTQFADRSAAVASWASKLPFSNFDSRALQLYVQHGLRDLPVGGVTLITDAPKVEAWIYILIEPLSKHVYEHLDEVGCPVVLACGGGGSPTDFMDKLMPAAVERLPNSRLHRFEVLHHFGPLEQPRTVAIDMLRFFSESQASSKPTFSRMAHVHSKL